MFGVVAAGGSSAIQLGFWQHIYGGTWSPQEYCDYNTFKRVYFNHSPDPEGLLAKLEAELDRRGIERIPDEPLRPDFFDDTGLPTAPGGP